ncbi:MAG: hypothetical protein GX272_03760 [Epulopiscium sp.]|nr:hypothetical protein [Candidatus Epulonipiscium sp.]
MYKVYKQIQELMYNCYIDSFFIQYGAVTNDYHVRGSKDKTTRIQVLFHLENLNAFDLRIDLAHKGVEYTHINIRDESGEYALPININKYRLLTNVVDINILNQLFYEYEDKYWFCSNYLNKIVELDLSKELKELLKNVFKEQSHFKVSPTSNNEEQQINLLNEHRIYFDRICTFNRNMLSNLIINSEDYFKRMKLRTAIFTLCTTAFIQDLENIKTDIIQILCDYYGYDEFSKEDLIKLDIISILEIVASQLYEQ